MRHVFAASNKKADLCRTSAYIAITALFSFLCLQVAFKLSAAQSLSGLGLMTIASGILFAVIFIRILLDKKGSPEWIFVIVAIPACIAFSLFMLPNYVPDEIWHIYRVFDIFDSGNTMMAPYALDQSILPSTYEEHAAALALPADYSNQFFVDRWFSTYSPLLYLVPGIMSALGQLVGVNPFVLIIFARLINAAFFVVAGYWIIKKLPFGKSIALVYLLNPILIQQESSCSADALTNIVALGFITAVLYVHFEKKPTKAHVVILIALAIGLLLAKYAYAPLVLLLLVFLPRVKNRRIFFTIVGALGTGVVAFIALVAIAPATDSTIGYMIGLFKDPLNCAMVMIRTVYDYFEIWIETYAGSALGPLSIVVWKPLIWMYYGLLLAAVFVSSNEHRSLPGFCKIILIVTAVILTVLLVSAFREWSVNVHEIFDSITGVQGRYFLPVLILPLLAAFNHRKYIDRPNCFAFFGTACGIYLLCCTATVIRFFV